MKKYQILSVFFLMISTYSYAQTDSIEVGINENLLNTAEIIDSHLNNFFEEDADIMVLDEIESDIIHRDVVMVKASEELPYNILLSCGMSSLPMAVPETGEFSEYAEVMILLPEDWKLNEEDFEDEKNYWPVRILKELMMVPHADSTWLGYGHSYGEGGDEEFAKGVGFSSVMLVNSSELSEDFTNVMLEDDKVIEIYTLIPLYKEELEYKKKHGCSMLLDKFVESDVKEVLEIGRKNVCKE